MQLGRWVRQDCVCQIWQHQPGPPTRSTNTLLALFQEVGLCPTSLNTGGPVQLLLGPLSWDDDLVSLS